MPPATDPPGGDPPTEERFGPYRILGVLGDGGMGRVLRAHDAEHERDVALKVLHPQWARDEGYRSRFRREARIAARLSEPHVIPIHRYGEIDGQLFLDMRLVEGEDLDSLLRRGGPMEPARAVDVVGQIGRALDAAHAGGLVHRDVKPSNVLLVARGDDRDLTTSAAGEDFAYLADFGIARGADPGTGPTLTASGTAIGSTDYMAPERFGSATADARSDVYSLACVLFELLTGRRPFAPGDPVALMHAHLHQQPPAPSQVRPSVPAALDAVVLRGLAKNPDHRWQSAGELATAARSVLAASGVPVPDPGVRRAPDNGEPRPAGGPAGTGAAKQLWITRLAWAVAALTVLAVLLLTALLVVTDRRADDAVDDAADAAQRLLRLSLPRDVDPGGCTVEAPAGDELRSLSCPAEGQADDVPTGTYSVLAGDGAAEAFDSAVEDSGAEELEDLFECGSGEQPQGWVVLRNVDDEPLGRLSCTVDDEGDSELRWIWDDLGTLGFVELRGGGEDGLGSLRSWWSDGADRGLL
ncbi:serine/threonine-protein kinase [Blastococcus sp. CT_GayMR20]|uniref:serine/threonine-protein kinase n=1 Tax=Blastococcus sp. CT_GayMR20 TaxID=2559609 RepID=UPI001ADD61F0|nr:serine/threonine-protein kinase [Blastococcus sp. CT_GayMR20]